MGLKCSHQQARGRIDGLNLGFEIRLQICLIAIQCLSPEALMYACMHRGYCPSFCHGNWMQIPSGLFQSPDFPYCTVIPAFTWRQFVCGHMVVHIHSHNCSRFWHSFMVSGYELISSSLLELPVLHMYTRSICCRTCHFKLRLVNSIIQLWVCAFFLL